MLLKRKIQVEEVVEVPLPAFFKDDLGHFSWCINESEDIIAVARNQITIWKKGTPVYDITLREVAKSPEMDSTEFLQAYNKALISIEAAASFSEFHNPIIKK